MGVEVIDVVPEDEPQVPFARDQHPVQALAAGTGGPAFGDGVCAGRLDRRLDDLHPDRRQHRVECLSEPGVPVPDEEPEAVSIVAGVHQQVARPLGHPLPVGAR